MAQSIEGAIARVQTLVGNLTGVRKAPTEPPASMNVFPFSICYVGAGEWSEYSNGCKQFLGDLMLELHVSFKDLPRNVETLMDYVEAVPDAILGDGANLNSTVSSCNGVRCEGMRVVAYTQGLETLALVWAIHVKMQNQLT